MDGAVLCGGASGSCGRYFSPDEVPFFRNTDMEFSEARAEFGDFLVSSGFRSNLALFAEI